MYSLSLKELREINKKSRKETALALGVAVRTLSHYECGTRKINLDQILVLATLYDVSAEEIIQAQFNSCQKAR